MAQHGSGNGPHRQEHQKFTAEELATLQSKQMTLSLDLTKQQQEKVKTLLTKRHSAIQAQREDRKTQKSETPDPQKRYSHMNSRLDAEIAFQQELKSILGEQKFTTWKEDRAFHQPMRQHHGKSSQFHRGQRPPKPETKN